MDGQENEVINEPRQTLCKNIQSDVLKCLNKYKEACLSLKMSINLDANVRVVHYSGNGRRSNPPMTIAETKANYSTHGITNWND